MGTEAYFDMFNCPIRVRGARQGSRRSEHLTNELCLFLNGVHQTGRHDHASVRSDHRHPLETELLQNSEGCILCRLSHFHAPRNGPRHFVCHEMKVIFDRVSEPR